MSSLGEVVEAFRAREGEKDILKAKWYIMAVAALAAASAGKDVPQVYQLATAGLSKTDQKIVQRRVKEAIFKTSVLSGVPRALQALLPLFETLEDDEIDHAGPRTDSLNDPEAATIRDQRGRRYFDIIWTEPAAEAMRKKVFKYHPDMYTVQTKMLYDWIVSDETILSAIETQMINVMSLICSRSPQQVLWHMKGVVRHGGSKEQARFAQDFGKAIAKLYQCPLDGIVEVEDIDFIGTTGQ